MSEWAGRPDPTNGPDIGLWWLLGRPCANCGHAAPCHDTTHRRRPPVCRWRQGRMVCRCNVYLEAPPEAGPQPSGTVTPVEAAPDLDGPAPEAVQPTLFEEDL